MRKTLTSSLPVILAVALAACDPGGADGQLPEGRDRNNWQTDFSKRTVPEEELARGIPYGNPKDAIPALDDPSFESLREADRWLGDSEPVAVVRNNGETKAYPLQVLIWHEIANDVVGGEPISITFCPLCNTTLAFERRFDGQVLDFGTTGYLRHSDLVMYDRQTETWWQQATGEGIVGDYAGEQLAFVPSPVMSWEDVKSQHPDARVLSRETGHDRNYGQNPYAGYDTRRGPISNFFRFGKEDDKLPAMERVVGLHEGDESLAVPFSEMEDARVAHVEVGGEAMVVFWAPGTASALDAGAIARGRDVGSSAVYRRALDGRELTFEAAGDGRYRDEETGSAWNLSGEAVEGELAGRTLQEVAHGNHFWFAWITFRPDTEVWRD